MLSREEIVEEGIVQSAGKGEAYVKVISSGGCEECSAKIYCGTGNEKNVIIVQDELGSEAGDKVRISIPGKNIANASTYIYGVPLVLLIMGVFAGNIIFSTNKELFSTLLGLVFIAIYSGIIYFYSRRKDFSARMPRIITLERKRE